MKHKKIYFIIMTLIVFIVVLSVGVFAYFSSSKNDTKNYKIDISTENRVNVSTFEELFAASCNSQYNDCELPSQVSDRPIITLTSDIELKSDLYITINCHLDLGSHQLILNGYTLTFEHGYDGVVLLSNGTIVVSESDKNCVILNTPNSFVKVMDTISFKAGESAVNSSEYIKVLATDSIYSAYNVFWDVANVLANDVSKRPKRLDYKDAYTLYTNNSSVFYAKDFMQNVTSCSFLNTSQEEACSFVVRDLDLPLYYYSSDIKINYSSSNTSVLSNFGNVTIPSESENVTLTVTVTIGEEAFSCDFSLHVVNVNNVTVKNKVGLALIKSYLQPYYQNSEYVFTSAIQLPLESNLGITFQYKSYNASGTSLSLFKDIKDSETNVVSTNAILFDSNSSCTKLEVSFNNDSSNAVQFSMRSSNSAMVTTNTSVARSLINNHFGGSIILDDDHRSYTLMGTGDKSISQAELTENGIQSLSFELINDTNNLYYIDNGTTLKINGSENPANYVQSVLINCIFQFTNETVQLQIGVVYNDDSGGNASTFLLPYYTYYNELLDATTGGSTITSFQMPFSYSETGPFICFDFAFSESKAKSKEYELPKPLTIQLYYNGAVRATFAYSGTDSLTVQLDQYISDNSLSLTSIAAYDDASWYFSIDASKITLENIPVYVLYSYKFEATASAWSSYEKTSIFYIKGGFVYSNAGLTNSISDSNMFVWMYNTFKPSNLTSIASSSIGDKVILREWLSKTATFDLTVDDSLANVSDFYPLKYMTGVRTVNLSGKQFATATNRSAILSVLKDMTWLESLNLSGCGLFDFSTQASVVASENPFLVLKTLDSLKLLHIENNSIFEFEWLSELSSLETVYLYSNQSSSSYYGNTGMVSYVVFDELLNKGVTIFNSISDSVPGSYEHVSEINDYIRLRNIEYQSVLQNGVDISILYRSFSTSYSDYNLSNAATLTWGCVGDSTTATYFTCTYQYNTDNVTFVIKYYVDRF